MSQNAQNPTDPADELEPTNRPGPIEMFEPPGMDMRLRVLSCLFDAVIVALCFWLVSLLLEQWPVSTLIGVALFTFAVTWTERR